jgi:hypothetical protein
MKTKADTRPAPRKLGVHAHDPAKKPRRIDRNFAQSSDIGEDRGSTQARLGRKATR